MSAAATLTIVSAINDAITLANALMPLVNQAMAGNLTEEEAKEAVTQAKARLDAAQAAFDKLLNP